ncbi:MAG: nucleolar protein 56 [archaeon GW2011_AR9]|nr:MAG: nucleolar protein 56 [archaeon GW2011_AR9]
MGSFIFNEQLKRVDFIPFTQLEDYQHKNQAEEKLRRKHPEAQPLPQDKWMPVMQTFQDRTYFQEFYTKNCELTKQGIKNSVSDDNLITQTIANINELDKVSNLLTKRLREWYSLYLPELSKERSSHEQFVRSVAEKSKPELLKELHLMTTESMGAPLSKNDVEEMQELALLITKLYQVRQQHEVYLEKIMVRHCPNVLELAGVTLGAKLMELGKSLKHLAMLPASTIQLLGAEKALFRHIKTGAKSPKYGILFQHPFIQNARPALRGKAARMLADKLSLCARLDYFKGEFKAKEYKKELEEKINR